MLVRACEKTPVAIEKTIQDPYYNYNNNNSVVGYNNTATVGTYDNRIDTVNNTNRRNACLYFTTILLTLCCAGLAGATLYYNQQAHHNASVIEQYSIKIFTDSLNFIHGVSTTYPQVSQQANNVANTISSYEYIGNDINYYTYKFENGRWPATIVIMSVTLLCFLLLLLITPIYATRRIFVSNTSSGLLTFTAVLLWLTAIVTWLLMSLHLVILKVDSDACVYADNKELTIETNPLFNDPTVASIASACLLNTNPSPAFSQSLQAANLDCSFLPHDYSAIKTDLCRSNGAIDSYSFITLFTFIIAVLLTLAAIFTESIAHYARIAKLYILDETSIVAGQQQNTTVVNQNNYIPEPTVIQQPQPYTTNNNYINDNNNSSPAITPHYNHNNNNDRYTAYQYA